MRVTIPQASSESARTTQRDDTALVRFQVGIEVSQGVVAYGLTLFAQRRELGQIRDGHAALGHKAVPGPRERLLQELILQRFDRPLLEGVAVRLHQPESPSPMPGPSVIPARTSATW